MGSAFFRRLALFENLKICGASIKVDGVQAGGYMYGKDRLGTAYANSIFDYPGHGHVSGHGKRTYAQLFAQGDSAITVGVGVASSTNLLALAALAAAGTTTFLNPTSAGTNLGAGFNDYPRTIQLAANSGVGNGTLSGASAKGIYITGVTRAGETATELVPLNGTSVVNTIGTFANITKIAPALNFVGGTDEVSAGYGTGLSLERPVHNILDILEFEVKASAATAYTVTTLPTFDVGEGSGNLNVGITAAATSIVLQLGQGATSGIPSGSQRTRAEIFTGDGSTKEKVMITNRSTDTLTVVRAYDGGYNAAWGAGSVLAWRPGMSMTPTITANDRYYLTYRTDID
jgi:hypothetical protein